MAEEKTIDEQIAWAKEFSKGMWKRLTGTLKEHDDWLTGESGDKRRERD